MPVAQPVTSQTTIARNKLIAVLTAEYAVEQFVVRADRLHKSLGRERTLIGVSPVSDQPWSNDKNVLRSQILVQFYGKWRDNIDPEQKVDPTAIETYAERFRRAVYHNDPNTNSVWYFNVTEVTYPPDPTGNITRFEARVEAIGNNSAVLFETG